MSEHYSRRNTCPMSEDFVFVKENFDENSERLSFISEEDKGSLRSAGLSADMRTQVSCPPLFFAELQKKTENMRKIQSLEGTKWRYDTIGY